MYSTQFSCRHVALIVLKKKRGGRLNRNILTSKPKKTKNKKNLFVDIQNLIRRYSIIRNPSPKEGVGGWWVPST